MTPKEAIEILDNRSMFYGMDSCHQCGCEDESGGIECDRCVILNLLYQCYEEGARKQLTLINAVKKARDVEGGLYHRHGLDGECGVCELESVADDFFEGKDE